MHQQQHYASLSLRLLASVCDIAIHTLIIACGLSLVLLQSSIKDTVQALVLFVALILVNPLLIYHSVFCLPFLGGSVGKLVTGLRVVDTHNHFLSFKYAFFRQTAGYQFSAILLGLGYLAIRKDPHRQAWHDKTIGSYVVVFHPFWWLGIIVTLLAFLFSGILFYQGFKTFATGPVPVEYNQTYQNQPTTDYIKETPNFSEMKPMISPQEMQDI